MPPCSDCTTQLWYITPQCGTCNLRAPIARINESSARVTISGREVPRPLRLGSAYMGVYLGTAALSPCSGKGWHGGPDGKRIRRKVSGKSRAVVQDRLRALHGDLDAGPRGGKLHRPPRRRGLAGRRTRRPLRQDDQEEPERPRTHSDSDRRPETTRTHRRRRASGTDGDGCPVLNRRRGDGPQRADPGNTLRRSPRPRRPQRRHPRRHPERTSRTAGPEPDHGPGIRAPGSRRGHQDGRLHRPVPGHRHPPRRSQGTALGERRLRRPGRAAARTSKRGRVALSTVPRGHQDRKTRGAARPASSRNNPRHRRRRPSLTRFPGPAGARPPARTVRMFRRCLRWWSDPRYDWPWCLAFDLSAGAVLGAAPGDVRGDLQRADLDAVALVVVATVGVEVVWASARPAAFAPDRRLRAAG